MNTSYLSQLGTLKEEHLPYVESDLAPYEVVSLGFLLYGEDKRNAKYILQELLKYLKNPQYKIGMLVNYAAINPEHWRKELLEALSIVGAKKVLRKLGFIWEDLLDFLPSVPEVRVSIHPLLKALYVLSEALTVENAQDFIMEMTNAEDRIDFNDFSYLEIFFLDWITKDLIKIGNKKNFYEKDVDIQIVVSYLKLKDMDLMKSMLQKAISFNALPAPSLQTEEKDNSKVISSASAEVECSAFSEEHCYLVRREKAGYALVFNQVKFEPKEGERKLRERRGSDVDKRRVEKVFSSFGYKIKSFDNLKHNQIQEMVESYAKKSSNYDSIIVVILSHGMEGLFYGSDSIPITINELEEMLCVPQLENKPKLLFIQACQSENKKPVKSNGKKDPIKYTDTLKAMSTIPGTDSFRSIQSGTWYIEALCHVIDKQGDRDEILKILTKTAKEVANKRGSQNEAMLPMFSSTLLKSFYFPPRNKR